MAKALEIGVADLIPKFSADTFVFFGAGDTTRAVAAGSTQSFFYGFYRFFIGIEYYFHCPTSVVFAQTRVPYVVFAESLLSHRQVYPHFDGNI